MAEFQVLMPVWSKARRELSFGNRDAVLEAIRDGHFNRYRIEADNRDHVFEILNVAHPQGWQDRSMSVGDVVLDMAEERASLCCMVGWEDLPEALLLLPEWFPKIPVLKAGYVRL